MSTPHMPMDHSALHTDSPGHQGHFHSHAPVVQTQLEVGAADDVLEQEADAAAEQVVGAQGLGKGLGLQNRNGTFPLSGVAFEGASVQRKCDACEDEEQGKVQRKPMGEGGAGVAGPQLSQQILSTQGGGEPLDPRIQSEMGSGFGRDFKQVKVHTGGDAQAMSSALNAKAFTVGQDIYFNAGQYQPGTEGGKRLLAHELTHTLQQSGGKVQRILRAVKEADAEKEFGKWATDNKKESSKTDVGFPLTVWEWLQPFIQDSNGTALPKPQTNVDKWADGFKRAEFVAQWLATFKGSTKDDQAKTFADNKIFSIGHTMAMAGLSTMAMAQVGGMTEDRKKLIYKEILKNVGTTTAAELETILTFQTANEADPTKVDFIDTLVNKKDTDLHKLNAGQMEALFKVMQSKYGDVEVVVKAMAATFIFCDPKVRQVIADKMQGGSLGGGTLLFKVLQHPYLRDTDLGGASLLKTVHSDKLGANATDADREKADAADLKDHRTNDLPFAVKEKQKYYVKFLTDLMTKHQQSPSKPADMSIGSLRTWLDADTEKIGKAAEKEYGTNHQKVFDIYRNLADIFFFHVHGKNADPDNDGKLGKLNTTGEPNSSRIEADCDVFATYAMRLAASEGYEPIGYIGLWPKGKFAGRDAHAAGLIRKGGTYFVINNKGILDTGVTETVKDKEKEQAIQTMTKLAVDDAYGDPKPTEGDLYYADAGPKGALPADFLKVPRNANYLRTFP